MIKNNDKKKKKKKKKKREGEVNASSVVNQLLHSKLSLTRF